MIHTRQAIRLSRSYIPRSTSVRCASTSASSRSSAAVTGVLAVTALGAAAIAHYYPSIFGLSSSPSSSSSSSGNSNETFTVSTGSGSRRKQHQFDLLSISAINARLAEHEQTTSISSDRPGNPVSSWHRNWVASNEPCEDRSAVDVIPRVTSARDLGWAWFSARPNKRLEEGGQDAVKPGEGEGRKDLVLFSIMDGHAGWATSELLSKVLHPTLALGLAGLQAGRLPGGGWLDRFKVWKETWTPENIAATLADSFVQLDTNLSQTPISLLPAYHAGKVDAATIASLTEAADNGACAISCLVDAEEGDLYVASTGDCRAVAGWEKDGVWRCDVLSEDQMGENPKEVARMQREHPGEEETVIMRGRVQGGLQPTRAFGDASYKWKKHEMDQLAPIMAAEGKQFRKQRPFNATPPYVTARPEVTHRKIRPDNGEKLRFIVMATDGLWDAMTSEESTLLLASYLSSQSSSPTSSPGGSSSTSTPTTTSRPTITPKSLLPSQISLSPPSGSGNPSDRPYPGQDLPGTGSRAAGTWALRSDKNAATYLIRNSLGGGDEGKLREMLSLKGDVSRWFRDDVTVTVIFFDEDRSS